jgi:hypothetical protein
VKWMTVPVLLVLIAAAVLLTAQAPLPIPPTHDPDRQSEPELVSARIRALFGELHRMVPRLWL